MKIIREIQLVNGEAIIPIRFPLSFIMTSKQKKKEKNRRVSIKIARGKSAFDFRMYKLLKISY